MTDHTRYKLLWICPQSNTDTNHTLQQLQQLNERLVPIGACVLLTMSLGRKRSNRIAVRVFNKADELLIRNKLAELQYEVISEEIHQRGVTRRRRHVAPSRALL